MFSNNERISQRQGYRLLFLAYFGSATMWVPKAVGTLPGGFDLLALGLGYGATGLYLWGLSQIQKRISLDHTHSFPLFMWIILQSVLVSSLTLFSFSNLMVEHLIAEEPIIVVILLILGIAAYGVSGGAEPFARAAEVLFWVVIIPFVLALIYSIKGINVDNFSLFQPVSEANHTTGYLKETIQRAFFIFLTYGSTIWMLWVPFSGKDSMRKASRNAFLLSMVLVVLAYGVLLGSFGRKAMNEIRDPIIEIMSSVQITGGFFKRTDALLMAIWFFALLMRLMLQSHVAVMLINEKLGKPKGTGIVSLLILLLVYWMYADERMESVVREAGRILTGPFLLLVPLVLLLCTGCGAVELEKRFFPMSLGVNEEGDFFFSEEQKRENLGKTPDYNHTKILLVQQDVFADTEKLDYLAEQLAKLKDMPWNTYILVAEEPKEYLDEAEGIELLLENHPEINPEGFPTIGGFLAEADNQDKTLLFPYLESEDDIPVITHYIKMEKWKERTLIPVREANGLFRKQGYWKENGIGSE